MIDKRCPCCGEVHPARVMRTDTGCAECECSGCGKRWTVKDGHLGGAFAFWPADIDAVLSDDIEPFFEGAYPRLR